jgi:ribonuclease P protein component
LITGKFNSLRLKKDFNNLSKNGKFIYGNSFSIKYQNSSESKIAFSVRKKLGKAPLRNKIKRRIREVVRNFDIKKNISCMIIVKEQAMQLSFLEICDEITKAFKKIENNN